VKSVQMQPRQSREATSATLGQMQVQVPAGIGPGMKFRIAAPGRDQFEVTCPPDASEGMTISVTVPAGGENWSGGIAAKAGWAAAEFAAGGATSVPRAPTAEELARDGGYNITRTAPIGHHANGAYRLDSRRC
jgi:hypothetical protein